MSRPEASGPRASRGVGAFDVGLAFVLADFAEDAVEATAAWRADVRRLPVMGVCDADADADADAASLRRDRRGAGGDVFVTSVSVASVFSVAVSKTAIPGVALTSTTSTASASGSLVRTTARVRRAGRGIVCVCVVGWV